MALVWYSSMIGRQQWHHLELIMFMVCLEGCFLYITFKHPDLVIVCSYIQFREEFETMKFIQQFMYQWNWEFVFNS